MNPMPSPTPLVFDTPAGLCFGWFHPARAPLRRGGVVLCRPLGYEALCSYRTYTQLADTLAAAGFDVLRFDYHGTGDSAGGDTDAGRVPAWIDSIVFAVHELRRITGIADVALMGMRLGATLAVRAALQLGDIDRLVLWAPCTTGKSFVREMRAASAQRGFQTAQHANGALEALGTLYSAQTVEEMTQLDCLNLRAAPAREVLVIDRDDFPLGSALPERYRELGMETTFATWPGYAGIMVAEPHEAVLPQATLDAITAWLTAAPAKTRAPVDAIDGAPAAPAWPASYALDGIRESPIAFGRDAALFGILAEPLEPMSDDRRGETAVLLLNVGGNYRIGPSRNYVKFARALAAAGYRALRLDLAGVGDSHTGGDFSGRHMYRQESTADVRAAIDALAARGCTRFFVAGICSGSYVAFETAQADARVTGQILMNSRLLEWDQRQQGNWQGAMQSYYKSSGFYWRALLHAALYPRLLRGEVDVRGIARRLAGLAQARLMRQWDQLLGRGTQHQGVRKKMKQLCARGCHTLMIMSTQDDGLDYVEFHLGRRGARMRREPRFRMAMVQDSDHTFSTAESQRAVLELVKEHLDALHRPAPGWSGLPGAQPGLLAP